MVNVESDRGLCTQPLNVISSGELPLSCALRPDSQTWMSSCEPSVRCVWSQRGSRTLITAALSRHWFLPRPLDHRHACGPPVCRFHWSPHSRLPTVVRFHLGDFKRIYSSRRTATHEWGSCVMSCPNAACHWVWENDSSGPDNASMFACTKSSDVDRSSQDSFSTKAPLKESEKPQLLLHCCSTFHYPCLSREFKANSGWWDFHSFSALRSAWLFSSAVQHIEQIFPWKLFITYETEGGDSWAVKS